MSNDINAKIAQDTLKWVKKLNPKSLQDGVTYVPTKGRPGPLAGAFLTLGVLLAGMNRLEERRAIRAGERYAPPREMDCGSCVLCHLDDVADEVARAS